MMKLPPHFKFQNSKPTHSISLEDWMIPKLFWQVKDLTIDDTGGITMHISNVRYGYQIYDPKIFFKFKNSKVRIRYSTDDLSFVQMYDYQYDNFICIVPEEPMWTKEHPEVFNSHSAKVKKINKFLKDRREEDKSKLSPTFQVREKSELKINRLLIDELVRNNQI